MFASLLLAVACAPAVPYVGDVVSSQPGTVDNGNSDTFNGAAYNHNIVAPDSTTCLSEAAWVIVAIDNNGSDSNDYVSELDLEFSDGSAYTTHNGAVEIPVMDAYEFMSEDISNTDLASFATLYVYGDDGVVLATLEPVLDAPWVTWGCPSS